MWCINSACNHHVILRLLQIHIQQKTWHHHVSSFVEAFFTSCISASGIKMFSRHQCCQSSSSSSSLSWIQTLEISLIFVIVIVHRSLSASSQLYYTSLTIINHLVSSFVYPTEDSRFSFHIWLVLSFIFQIVVSVWCVCACVRGCVRLCVCVHVCVCLYVHMSMLSYD